MVRRIHGFGALLLLACLPLSQAFAQFGGSRVGLEDNSRGIPTLPQLGREVVEGFIVIDGRAEVRVRPTDIRVVLAVTSEGASAQECQQTVEGTMERLKTAWGKLEIAPNDIVEDFIAVLPLYQWNLDKRGDADVGVEEEAGFRMQTNVHLAVPNDAKAPAALRAAFEQGVTDIVAVHGCRSRFRLNRRKQREQNNRVATSAATRRP